MKNSSSRPHVTPARSLEKIQQTWAKMFNSNAALRKDFNDVLENMGLNDCLDDWTSVQRAFSDSEYSLDLTAVAGASTSAGARKVYAMPTYGWDGGNSITTSTLNLETLTESSIFSGPGASLVVRADPSFPGIAIHLYEADNTVLMQLF